ncbi:LytTR family transcriptional regulator DNA-binding domain-containing protein [Cohnella sp. GCM10027633]|uniref:LytTR family transcriptional regulator DNA-binding domain-containing protein n=1 Tax=unclassified Cohnella TaxID=2636738 RepID=UPI00363232C3
MDNDYNIPVLSMKDGKPTIIKFSEVVAQEERNVDGTATLCYVTKRGTYTPINKIRDAAELFKAQFVQVNQGFLVNMATVSRYDETRNEIVFQDGSREAVDSDKIGEVKRHLGR